MPKTQDIGAGSVDRTLAAARRVGPTGFVLATDILASMLEMTAMSARQEGLSNVDTRVMDAQRLDLESDSFDVVISRFALMLIPGSPGPASSPAGSSPMRRG